MVTTNENNRLTVGHFTLWISLSPRLSLSPKFGRRPKIRQKVKSFFVKNRRIAQRFTEWFAAQDQTSDWAIAGWMQS